MYTVGSGEEEEEEEDGEEGREDSSDSGGYEDWGMGERSGREGGGAHHTQYSFCGGRHSAQTR